MQKQSTNPQSLVVEFSAYFLRAFLTYCRHRWNFSDSPEVSVLGLLFGAAARTDLVIQNFRVLHAHPGATQFSDSGQWCRAFNLSHTQTAADHELAWLECVGWFSIRHDSAIGLLASEIEFHNGCFPKGRHVGVVFHPGPEELLTADLYTNTGNSALSATNHSRCSVSLSLAVSPATASARPVVQKQFADEFFLRAYDVASALDREEKWAEWKDRMRSVLSVGQRRAR